VVPHRHQRHQDPPAPHPRRVEHVGNHLSHILDMDKWQLNPRIFATRRTLWDPHTIDRFVSVENAQLRRNNARWRDLKCEDVDNLHLPYAIWRHENKYCNPRNQSHSRLAPRCTNPAQQLKLSPRIGRTNHDIKYRTISPSRPSTTPLPSYARHLLSRSARHAQVGRTTRLEHSGISASTPALIDTLRGAIGKSLRSVSSYIRSVLLPLSLATPPRTCPPCYHLNSENTGAS
jgi:hypothetical protein